MRRKMNKNPHRSVEQLEIIIKGNPKEIADLVLAVQSRQTERESPIKFLEDAYRSAIYDIAEE